MARLNGEGFGEQRVSVRLAWIDRCDMREAGRHFNLGVDLDMLADHAALAEHTPVFLTEAQAPHPDLFGYGLHMASTVAPSTARQYRYTTKRFVDYLEAEGVALTGITEEVLRRYRHERTATGMAATTWSAEAIVIRRLIDYLVQTGKLGRRPWIEVGQRNVLSTTVRAATNVRHLTARQWLAFREIGLLGKLPDGSHDRTVRRADGERNVLGCEIAIGTGMRLAEFSTMLTTEAVESQFTVQACAKGSRSRDIYLTRRANQLTAQYIRGNRAALVRSRQSHYRRIKSDLIIVSPDQLRSGRVLLPGATRRVPVSALGPRTRRRLFVTSDDCLEPAALFLGNTGLMLGTSAWSRTFRCASDRVATFPDAAQTAGGVSAHDLRHTFAIRMMGHLVRAGVEAYQRRVDRGENPQQSIGEVLALNPLTTLQHRLGHTSPATTSVYLRYVEDAQALIERVLTEWDDEVGDLLVTDDLLP